MFNICSLSSTNPSFRYYKCLPILFWFFGILTGVCFAYANQASFFPLMRSVVSQPVSIVGLLVSVFLPLLLSPFSGSFIVLLLSLIKAVSFGFSSAFTFWFFGDAAWLFGFLFLFSDGLCLVVLLRLWLQRFCGNAVRGIDYYFCTMFCLLTTGIDYLFISPYLQGLL